MSRIKQAHTILLNPPKPKTKPKKPVYVVMESMYNECSQLGKNTDAKDCPPVNIEFAKEKKEYGFEP